MLTQSVLPFVPRDYYGMDPKATSHSLPSNLSRLDSQICAAHGGDQVCGRCVSGHSVYFHSIKCTYGPERLCSVGWLFYLLSEIVPLVLLFATIIIFNISFTNGNVNCFIFYAQILDVVDIDAKGSIEFVPSIKILQYIQCVLIQSLSAFVVLCYSQCTRVTLHILNAFCIDEKNMLTMTVLATLGCFVDKRPLQNTVSYPKSLRIQACHRESTDSLILRQRSCIAKGFYFSHDASLHRHSLIFAFVTEGKGLTCCA